MTKPCSVSAAVTPGSPTSANRAVATVTSAREVGVAGPPYAGSSASRRGTPANVAKAACAVAGRPANAMGDDVVAGPADAVGAAGLAVRSLAGSPVVQPAASSVSAAAAAIAWVTAFMVGSFRSGG